MAKIIYLSPAVTRFTRRYCPRTYTATVLLVVILLVGLHYTYSKGWISFQSTPEEEFPAPDIEFTARHHFANILQERANEHKEVMLAMTDLPYASTSLNFYVASLKKHKLRNIVFIAIDRHSCDIMSAAFAELKSACFAYKEIGKTDTTPSPKSVVLKDSTYLKRFFVLEALKLGYTVLQIDMDMIFLHDPLPATRKACGKCDLAILWDEHLEHYDPAYVYAKPTEKAITLYNRLASYELSHGAGKLALNAALKESKKGKLQSMKFVPLAGKAFQVGHTFFERNSCPLAKAFKGVIVVHNNYIQEAHNKNFRLKECMLWDWDGFGFYFSNATRKYMTVESSGELGQPEHQTLLNAFAIARLLRRTLVLPRLKCKQETACNLLTRMYDHSHITFLKRFNAATGHNYRESTFLQNPRVPTSVKQSVSPIFHIDFKEDADKAPSKGEPIKHLVPRSVDNGPTTAEIKAWLGNRSESILRFDSLLGWFSNLNYDDIVGHHLVNIVRQL